MINTKSKNRKIGKRIGNCLYIHCNYENLIENQILEKAKEYLKDHSYTCLKYNKKNGNITFQWSPDFDISDEPIVGKSILVKQNGDITVTNQKKDPQIWHDKWMWVGDDYNGFDIEKSKKRSKLWRLYVLPEEKCKIGTKSFWDKVKKRWEKG